jgi:hypothetical protein
MAHRSGGLSCCCCCGGGCDRSACWAYYVYAPRAPLTIESTNSCMHARTHMLAILQRQGGRCGRCPADERMLGPTPPPHTPIPTSPPSTPIPHPRSWVPGWSSSRQAASRQGGWSPAPSLACAGEALVGRRLVGGGSRGWCWVAGFGMEGRVWRVGGSLRGTMLAGWAAPTPIYFDGAVGGCGLGREQQPSPRYTLPSAAPHALAGSPSPRAACRGPCLTSPPARCPP